MKGSKTLELSDDDGPHFIRMLRALGIVILVSSWTVSGQVPILAFPAEGEGWGTLPRHAGDITSGSVAEGDEGVVYHAKFSDQILRNPTIDSLSGQPWSTPDFYGGYLLYLIHNANGSYGPNFVRGVGKSEGQRGRVSLPVSTIINSAQSGTLTNSVFGTFVTHTAISGVGEFRIHLHQHGSEHHHSTGATAAFRGAVFDGVNWLVTNDETEVPTTGVEHATISTRSGWRILDTNTFTFGEEAVELAGPITRSGVWFMASETASPQQVGFAFAFSDSYFTPWVAPTKHDADSDENGAIDLLELLRVIEIYNTRLGNRRTGRYTLDGDQADGISPDISKDEKHMALFPRYYSADSDRDGAVSLAELLRVIELYNTRTGTQRTGRFILDDSTSDGFAPNPQT